jgi:ligand-binding sensor domain-containing protein
VRDCSLAFDAAGNLWLGSDQNLLSELAKAKLAKSGSPAPEVTITSNSLSAPCKPTFDRSGNLWASSTGLDAVVEFAKAKLAKSGSPAPTVVISSADINNAGDVAIDRSGNPVGAQRGP